MKKKINDILKNILQKIDCKEEEKIIKKELIEFIRKIKKTISQEKIDAEIFVGGSFAKSTVIRKKIHDVDIFIRFAKKYEEKDFSKLLKRILKGFKGLTLVHGSRDYYQVKISNNFFIEVVPVLKVNNPKQARNITDLSYSHVKYVRSKTKSKKILDEIKLAKAFCEAKGVYGAESYIKGFSGYALELLILHYKTFSNFLEKITNLKQDKIIIDMEKQYKNKNQILMDLNESKLISPIILIDPTYKQRNALAALSNETFEKFKQDAKKFLKYPSEKDFEIQKIDLDKVKLNAKKNKQEFVLIEINTKKQSGDIAGSKLLKFYNHLSSEIDKLFEIKNRGFNYNDKKSAKCFFVVKTKKQIILEGPLVKDIPNVVKFKKKHGKTFSKKGRVYVKKKNVSSLKEFVKQWKINNKTKIKEMDIIGLDVV